MKINEVILDGRAQAYFQSVLSNGHTLAKIASQAVDLSQGTFSTWLPSNLAEPQVYDLRSGGKFPHVSAEAWFKARNERNVSGGKRRSCLAAKLADSLQKISIPICIFENGLSQPGDAALMKMSSKLWFFENEVYHAITSPGASLQQIQDSIREAETLPFFIGGIAAMADGEITMLSSRGNISIEALQIIAKNLNLLLVSAYDGESYVVWCKSK